MVLKILRNTHEHKRSQVYRHAIKKLIRCFLVLSLACICVCAKKDQAKLRGLGLHLQKEQLLWTINVGVLTDSEFPELSLDTLKKSLERSVELISVLLPGIYIQYIIDQPMNAVFIMERSLPTKNSRKDTPLIVLRNKEDNPIIALGDTINTHKINTKKLDLAGFSRKEKQVELKKLQDLSKLLTPKNTTLLSDKLTVSDFVWRAYMRHQIRYDLVLTNAFVYSDDLSSRSMLVLTKNGGVRWALSQTPGRTAMEGYGAYISYGKIERGRYQLLQEKQLIHAIQDSLLNLILPLQTSKKNFTHWKKRLTYLKSIARLVKGIDISCQELKQTFQAYHNTHSKIAININQKKRKAMNTNNYIENQYRETLMANHRVFLRHCSRQ